MSAEIIHGDALAVLRTLPDASVDAVITDPPYGTENLGGGYGRRQLHGGRGGRTIANDRDLSALESVLPEVMRVLRADAWVGVFCAARKRRQVDALLEGAGLEPFGEVIWNKRMPGLGYTIRYSHETVIICRRGEPAKQKPALLSVLTALPNRHARHPHEKPVSVMAELVRWACPDGGTVLDPFAGSGSTGVACVERGRNFIGVELDAAFVALARNRIAEAEATPTLGIA